MGAPDGSSGSKVNKNIWASNEDEQNIELSEEMIGELAPEAQREAMQAAAKMGREALDPSASKGPPGKRTRKA